MSTIADDARKLADEIEALTAARKAGYSQGYEAGRRRKMRAISAEQRHARERAFWQRAMLAAIPFALTQSTWKRGKDPINSLHDRMQLAADAADAAVTVAQGRGQL